MYFVPFFAGRKHEYHPTLTSGNTVGPRTIFSEVGDVRVGRDFIAAVREQVKPSGKKCIGLMSRTSDGCKRQGIVRGTPTYEDEPRFTIPIRSRPAAPVRHPPHAIVLSAQLLAVQDLVTDSIIRKDLDADPEVRRSICDAMDQVTGAPDMSGKLDAINVLGV